MANARISSTRRGLPAAHRHDIDGLDPNGASLKTMLEHQALERYPRHSNAGTWHFRRAIGGAILPQAETLMLSDKRKYPVRNAVAGYRPKQKIVRFAGRDGRAEAFHYALVFPDPGEPAAPPATSLQVAAFMRRVGFSLPEGAAMDQVSQMLSAQEFATRVLHSRSAPSAAARDALIRYAVGFISTEPAMRSDIRRRMRLHHEGRFDPFEPAAPYYRPPRHFVAITRFADAVVADMRAAGALSFG